MRRCAWLFLPLLMGCSTPHIPSHPPETCGLLFLGTSLTAGYGLPEGQSPFPQIISERLAATGSPYDILNAGVPGETSAGLLERVATVLAADTIARRFIIVETGANDMLQFLSPSIFAANLRQVLDTIQAQKPEAHLLLLRVDPGGARALPGQGANGGLIMDSLRTIAAERQIPIVEDLLIGVRRKPEFNQPDRLHPNALGHERLADNVWPALSRLLIQSGCPVSRPKS